MARNSFLTAIFIILNVYWVSASPTVTDVTCDARCPTVSADKINVHLVPHSHDDVGWLSTVEEYYNGSGDGTTIDQVSVKKILDSTIEALKKNPARRYVQVETTFFWMYWQEQSNDTRKDVIDLVNNGQLEMTNGALSMNDEADTNYQSIIDQFTWGLEILNQTVGPCGRPKIGWQIDPFGHSKEHASILKQMGFEGLVIGRIDHNDKEDRKTNKKLDFNWKTSNTLNDSVLFTTIFPNFYVYEQGFCFDIFNFCQDTITDENRQRKISDFEKILTRYASYYQTKNILIPMGHEFAYQKAETNFGNSDRLIEGFKDNEQFNVFYSTPSCYIKAVQDAVKASKITLPTKDDDFFPYASDNHAYWTGYFTSRPTVKRFERVGNNILQSVKQLMALSKITNVKKDEAEEKNNDEKLSDLRIAMGVLQHHEAITGTEKQKVANDYVSMLHKAIKNLEEPVGKIVANLLKKSDSALDLKLTNCLLANVSICSTSGKDKFLAVIQNPLSRVVDHYVRLPVDGTSFKITGPAGDVKYDVFDAIIDFAYVKETEKPLPKELVFKAEKIPPLGINVYYIENLKDSNKSNYYPFKELSDNKDTVFGDQNKFEIDITTKKLKSITINGHSLFVTQEFLYYDGFTSDKCNYADSQRCPGAYIFRPVGEAKTLLTDTSKIEFAKGSLVHEVRQIVNEEVTQIIRIYLDQTHVEFDWLVGNLPTDKGTEIITRFKVENFTTNGVFYTDSNGREQIKRTRNDKKGSEPIASNYYPVTSRIVIKDDNTELAVLNDRAQGGSSLNDGEIELMVHRRLLNDDGFGVGEPLNEVEYDNVGLHARGHHYLTFGPIKPTDCKAQSTAAYERELALQKLRAPWVLLADATVEPLNSLNKIQKSIKFTYKPINDTVLDDSVQILSLEPWADSCIFRLEHILEKEEGPSEISVELNDLFILFNVTEIRETTLGANQWLDEFEARKKYEWKIKEEAGKTKKQPKTDLTAITLEPMQIRTFIVKVQAN